MSEKWGPWFGLMMILGCVVLIAMGIYDLVVWFSK